VNIADEKAVEKCRKLFRSSDEPRKIFLVLEPNNERCSPVLDSYQDAPVLNAAPYPVAARES
jgi:hypothetical protein